MVKSSPFWACMWASRRSRRMCPPSHPRSYLLGTALELGIVIGVTDVPEEHIEILAPQLPLDVVHA
eukprot:4775193-Pyramimonas_sp.AAC.1